MNTSASLQTAWTSFTASSATYTGGEPTGAKGGIWRITSGASSGSTVMVYPFRACVASVLTDRWYIAWRTRIPTAVDAQTVCGGGLINSNQGETIMAGVNGGNTTNFTVSHDSIYLTTAGNLIDLGVAIDTSFHIYEMWGTGSTTLNARIDAASTLTATLAGPATFVTPGMIARNGTTATTRQTDGDWVLMLTPRL